VIQDFLSESAARERDGLADETGDWDETITFFTVGSNFTQNRVASFTRTAEEEFNGRDSGNVILIDNHLKWDKSAVTILHPNGGISLGRILFLGLQNTEGGGCHPKFGQFLKENSEGR
jgi:hypothetical protein